MALSKYDSTRETTNYSRIDRMIKGPCTDVLRDILRKDMPPSALLHNFKVFIANQSKTKKNLLNQQQQRLVFSGRYSEFDITLLYFIFRNICLFSPHNNQWGNDPDPTDRSLSANIERIRARRNKYCGHNKDFSITDSEFKQICDDLLLIVQELESYLGFDTKYQDALRNLKICSMQDDFSKLEGKTLLYISISALQHGILKQLPFSSSFVTYLNLFWGK